MKNKLSVAAIAFSLFALVMPYFSKSDAQSLRGASVETTYDRIIRTKTVRCAYQVWPPYINKDPNNGKMSGVYYELIEKMGRDLNLKINWAEEVGSADMFEGFKTGRIDMLCSPVTSTTQRSLVSDFSKQLAFDPYYIYVRADDTRFDNSYDKANNENISMLTSDGYFGAVITKEEFPKAKLISLPNFTTDVDVLMGISTGKADAAICEATTAQNFMKNNPGKIKQVIGLPVGFPSLNIAFPVGEDRLRAMINTSLSYYLDTGTVDKILTANGLDEAKVLRVAKPYEKN